MCPYSTRINAALSQECSDNYCWTMLLLSEVTGVMSLHVQMCSHISAAAPAANLNSSGDVAPTPYDEIPTITRITEQGNPCLLPYVINVSSCLFLE